MKFENIPKHIFLIIISSSLASLILILNFLYLRNLEQIFALINIFSGIMILLPIILYRYKKYKKVKEIDDMFTIFLRDFVEATRGGMTVLQAFKSVSRNDYKVLSPYVKKIAAQLEWGMPLEKILRNFANETNSSLIKRTVDSVIESHRFGGNLAETFEALSRTALEIDRLKKERKTYLHSQLITGYVVFFVFLGVIIGLERFLVPSLTQIQPYPGKEVIKAENIAVQYKDIFRNLIIIQGFFAGLTVGKLSEGALIAGLKHSLIMIVIGSLIFTFLG